MAKNHFGSAVRPAAAITALVTLASALALGACRPPRNRYDWRAPAGATRACHVDADCPSGQCVFDGIGESTREGTCSGGSGETGSSSGGVSPNGVDGGPRAPRPDGHDAPAVQPAPGDIHI